MQTFAIMFQLCAAPIPVTINTTERLQVMDGFGASDCWSFQKIGEWDEDKKNEIADLLFSVETGIGLSQWRFNIGGGINPETIDNPWRTVETFETGPGEYDWSRQSEERWFLDAAKLRGVDDFIAFVNSPPGRMTRNGLTNCTDGNGTTNLKNGWENQFARYLKDILLHFKEHWNLEFSHISPVNEPQWEWNNGSNQEGNRASNDDIRAIAIALHDSLQDAGLATEISLVESGDLRSWYQFNTGMGSEYGQPYGSYLNALMDHPDLDGKLAKHIGSHSYWSDRINTQLVQNRQELAFHLRDYLEDGWKYWVTEYTILDGSDGQGGHGRDLSMETAIDVTRVIHHDLTLLNASAWQWWTAVSPEDFKDGLIYTDYRENPSQVSIIESKLLWAFGHYSRFIRPGYQRVGMTGASNKFGLMGSAFVSDNDDTLVAVFINAASGSKEIDLGISGLSWGDTFKMYLTSDEAGNDLKRVDDVNLDQSIVIPARSLVTLVGSRNTANPPFEGYDSELYQLYQNYPNPFNSETRLSFNLPEPGSVELSIYSLRGEKVHSVSWPNLTEGLQHYTWAASQEEQTHLNSGIYLYTLRAGNIHQTKKMVFIQ
jgi:O-glycosyl hydrolase